MREKSIRYRAPEQLRQRSRREAPKPPSGTTLPIRYRRMAEETARSEPEGRGTPSGSRAATDDKNGPQAPPRSGPEPTHNDGRSGASGRKPDGKTTTNIRTGRPRDAIRQPGGNRRQNGPQAPPRSGPEPTRTTTAGAEPQGGDRRKKTTEPPPKETAPNKFDMRYSVNAFRIPTRRRPQASTRASPDRPDSRSSAQRSSRRPLRRQAPAACAPHR